MFKFIKLILYIQFLHFYGILFAILTDFIFDLTRSVHFPIKEEKGNKKRRKDVKRKMTIKERKNKVKKRRQNRKRKGKMKSTGDDGRLILRKENESREAKKYTF